MKVCFVLCSTAVFCTGARDGNIMVWDTRCSKKGTEPNLLLRFYNGKNPTFGSVWCYYVFLPDGFYRQVKQISGAHNKAEPNPPSKTKKRRSSMRGMAPSVVSFLNNWTDLNFVSWSKDQRKGEAKLILKHLIFFAGHPAECHSGFVSRSTHPHLFRGCWWVRNYFYL